ncbi:ESX-1 secretion-associated protein EspI [Mycobacterium shigaense]|uniref:ESX-1 secretion-associated protein EspI n=1 Tax=Mycobacterium shigaense TaxID=722731 RepID=A0A1Z4EFJ0_9MYCO|nr:hypothetical protein [Mycobacterium shigaense]PRI16449.1 hypothetical protein B2J96_06665 [Mycobacterium shigaense]BAX91722.1 ESX-1 secretion-associated protein EspI [Mycobacterium shigaense]
MNNRGSLRGPGQPQSAAPPWRADPTAATVPEPYYRPPARPAPRAPRRELTRGGTALDGLDDLESPFRAGCGWRDLVRCLTGVDLGPSKDSAYEDELRIRIRTGIGGAFPVAVLNFRGGVAGLAITTSTDGGDPLRPASPGSRSPLRSTV